MVLHGCLFCAFFSERKKQEFMDKSVCSGVSIPQLRPTWLAKCCVVFLSSLKNRNMYNGVCSFVSTLQLRPTWLAEYCVFFVSSSKKGIWITVFVNLLIFFS